MIAIKILGSAHVLYTVHRLRLYLKMELSNLIKVEEYNVDWSTENEGRGNSKSRKA